MYSVVRSISSVVVGFAALLMFSTALVPTSAQAASRGSVSWSFTSDKVEAGSAIDVTYKPFAVRPASVLTFQRQFGTAKVWRVITTIHLASDASATAKLPSAPQGGYEYRAEVTAGRKILVITHDHPLYSYGPVTLLTICNQSTNRAIDCGPGTVQLANSTLYNYQASGSVDPDTSPGQTDFAFGATSCQSGSLNVVVGFDTEHGGAFPGASATVQIAQSASDPQLLTVPDTSQQTFKFNLDGGPFDLDSWFTTNGQNGWENIYLSGTFSCYTLNGKA